jgi:hypothetical protein
MLFGARSCYLLKAVEAIIQSCLLCRFRTINVSSKDPCHFPVLLVLRSKAMTSSQRFSYPLSDSITTLHSNQEVINEAIRIGLQNEQSSSLYYFSRRGSLACRRLPGWHQASKTVACLVRVHHMYQLFIV